MGLSHTPISRNVARPAGRLETYVTVLLVTPSEADWRRLSQIFQHTNWILYRARDYAEATEILRAVPAATIITEANLPGRRTWMDLLEYASSTRSHVIVTSDCEDVSLWAKVLNLGGYDVLMKPFDSEEVLRVISLAWRSWKDRCERRLDGKPPANH